MAATVEAAIRRGQILGFSGDQALVDAMAANHKGVGGDA